jgi:DNA ligase-1
MDDLVHVPLRPLLAAKFDLDKLEDQLSVLRYPIIASPKIDGIRILCSPQLGPVTRKVKPIPNDYIRRHLWVSANDGFDGELVVGAPHTTGDGTDVFNRTTRVMRKEGEPDFTYYVFDNYLSPHLPYNTRLQQLVEKFVHSGSHNAPRVKLLESRVLQHPVDVLDYEAECLERGYEGIMLRNPSSYYKFNRGTLREQILIKLKRVTETEGQIINVEPRYRNDNEAQLDALGYTKRSSHKENKTPLDMLGRFIVKSPEFTEPFGVGTGFDHTLAREWWQKRDILLGATITFKYQACGTRDKPRHPVFLRFRAD